MSRVEVPAGQVIAQAGDLAPRDGGLSGQQIGGQRLNGPDLQQPDADRVEYEAIGEGATLQVERIASIAAWMSASRWRSR